ncbi:MAG: phosphoribosylaminoimidazolesuccinocarboxamide synthase [Candidatus Diapherotrites archaeon]|uniref:Phosphoribosylaminoimidazole-succinocarboxamide synthase n=1 Tax=Candidatus Iainarchaeum sp. TaxID=3101447 RepID=A0A939C6I3_9ARCH|nr:phosphoribosylaminoimidazolesuccinocarboxamide synthase [Candidatus Diapherotrites archaeon]
MGSVKDLKVEKPATGNETGIGIFHFTDDYSVFDYGKMPDIIPGKGEALCRIAAFNFEQLEKLGIKTHYRRLVKGNEMEVDLVRVLYPQKGELKEGMSNYLVPLEVIFRNSLPEGSSVFKRLNKGQATIEELGLTKMPKPGERLESPIMDVSTKLEPSDRYLSWKEAGKISCLSNEEVEKLKETALKINDFLTKRAEKFGIEHADGKVEFALDPDRSLILVDVCGTLDENRFLYNGVHLSKQVLRDYYKTTPWYGVIEREKGEGKGHGEFTAPEKLPKELIGIVANMYKSVTEAWTGKKIWNAPSIEKVIQQYRKFLEKVG